MEYKMKRTLLSLTLASILLLGNGCEERKPRETYTLKEGNTEIKLEDYWHEYNLEIKTPEGKRIIYAEKYRFDDEETHVTKVINYTATSTNIYFRDTPKGRRILKDTQPEFNKYFKTIQQERATNTQKRINNGIESSSLFKQFK